MSPCRGTNPYVGFSPTTPQNAAGCRTEPPVSDPSAAKHAPDETAAALPPELPPGTKHASVLSPLPPPSDQGLRVRPWWLKSVPDPIPNSSMLVLPRRGAPASRRRWVGVESYGGVKLARAAEEAVVETPRVQKLSFAA